MATILGTGKQRSGKNSRIKVAAQNLTFAKFSVTFKGDDLDTVNFESNGVDEGILGIIGAEYSAGGDWDAGTNPFDAPPGIYPRDDLATVKFYNNVADNTFWNFPYLRVRSAVNSSEVKGKVAFEWSGMNQGSFFNPTGSV